MDGLSATRTRGLENARDVEIALACRGRPDAQRLVRGAHMVGVRVGIGVHRDGADAQPPRRAEDAAGDFAAVGDQQALDHGRSERTAYMRNTPKRVSSPGRVRDRGQRQAQHAARVERIDDAIVPEPRRGIVRMSLALVLLADRLP